MRPPRSCWKGSDNQYQGGVRVGRKSQMKCVKIGWMSGTVLCTRLLGRISSLDYPVHSLTQNIWKRRAVISILPPHSWGMYEAIAVLFSGGRQ